MKRILIATIVSALSLSLGGCGGHLTRFDRETAYEEEMADARIEVIIAALESEDKEALKAMFSQQALNEISEANIDLDKQINEAFEYYQGEMESYKGSSRTSSMNTRNKSHSISVRYTIVTNKETYQIKFDECLANGVAPEEIGIYFIEIITVNDKDQIEGFKWRNSEAGIRVRAEG